MNAFIVTVRQLGVAPLVFFAIGRDSATVAIDAAARFDACGVTIKPTQRR
jgi:hypothetical protein